MSDKLKELEGELEKLLAQRDKIRDKQVEAGLSGHMTRARTTTFNARASQVNDMVFEYRDMIKKLKAQSNG